MSVLAIGITAGGAALGAAGVGGLTLAGGLAAGAAVGGTVASMQGAKKQSKAITAANKANAKSVDDTNKYNYRMWLESRGVGENGQAVNAQLPRWMTVPSGGRSLGWTNQAAAPAAAAPAPVSFIRRKAAAPVIAPDPTQP
jgi:succinate dehydrogenase/fumarate reductase flavoprotein subunit